MSLTLPTHNQAVPNSNNSNMDVWKLEIPTFGNHDNEFYLNSSIFLVEDRLFKLPTLHLTLESEVFKTMFQLPQNPKMLVEGVTDLNPIRLDGVKREDFKNLLRVIYFRPFLGEESQSEEQWISVLALSAKWEMERIRKLAIDKLTSAFSNDPHKLVVMGRKYDVDTWLTSGIQMLVARNEPMGKKDAKLIGTAAVIKVSAIREWTLRWKLAHRDSTDWILNRQDMPLIGEIQEKIKESFGSDPNDKNAESE